MDFMGVINYLKRNERKHSICFVLITGIYYTQYKRVNLGDLIDETLGLFERYGM